MNRDHYCEIVTQGKNGVLSDLDKKLFLYNKLTKMHFSGLVLLAVVSQMQANKFISS